MGSVYKKKPRGITTHALQQSVLKSAPVISPKKLRRKKAKKEIIVEPASQGRKAFRFFHKGQQEEFVYIMNKKETAVVTVLTKEEYQTFKNKKEEEDPQPL